MEGVRDIGGSEREVDGVRDGESEREVEGVRERWRE
jgi:hypothetical protein